MGPPGDDKNATREGAMAEKTKEKATGKAAGTSTVKQPEHTAPEPAAGRFVWHELATTDPGAAQKYYKKVIGWGTAPFEGSDPDKPYTMWTSGQTPQGGVMELPEMARKDGAPPHWLTYVGVADADKTAAKVKQLGGKVLHGPESIPNVGRFAVLADPQGAVFAVIKGEGDPPPAGEPGPGAFSWHELS